MLRGLWRLTWLEIKIFMREPLGVFGSVVIPTLVFVAAGRLLGRRGTRTPSGVAEFVSVGLPVFVSVLIALSAVVSLVTIIAIYREGGILKRLRATPLSPLTILGAHVFVKLIFTVLSLLLLVAAGRRLFPGAMDVPLISFAAALLLSTISILSLGFIIASIVPTARFAQPVSAAVMYPMVALSGLFFPIARLPLGFRLVAQALPTTHAVALLQGVWDGSGWSGHWMDAAALVVLCGVFSAASTRIFRWE